MLLGEFAFDIVNEFFDLFFDVHGEDGRMAKWRN